MPLRVFKAKTIGLSAYSVRRFRPPSSFRYNLFDLKPTLIIFGRNVGRGLCDLKVLVYLPGTVTM